MCSGTPNPCVSCPAYFVALVVLRTTTHHDKVLQRTYNARLVCGRVLNLLVVRSDSDYVGRRYVRLRPSHQAEGCHTECPTQVLRIVCTIT